MITFDIRLSKMDDVRRFVAITSASPVDVDLAAGRYLVDAKSIMGIFSLDLTKPITLEAHTEDDTSLESELEPFIFKEDVE